MFMKGQIDFIGTARQIWLARNVHSFCFRNHFTLPSYIPS